MDMVCMTLAGRASEEIFFEKVRRLRWLLSSPLYLSVPAPCIASFSNCCPRPGSDLLWPPVT